jgi:hypothetical protein
MGSCIGTEVGVNVDAICCGATVVAICCGATVGLSVILVVIVAIGVCVVFPESTVTLLLVLS